ncbi:PREDICTED: uncharacterized protein LOC108567105 [Nicrophorus vespilloides]|uniref:Uncharacterized protein LOC108567105 n=1 Tax=Nicrophorus vespilloides TaxID=110193 RepID=A0ABM1N7Q9_NICVS|nr:PREDICTED: uncharacterized protein LOC108567105 [Nicrophorus vespilloides]
MPPTWRDELSKNTRLLLSKLYFTLFFLQFLCIVKNLICIVGMAEESKESVGENIDEESECSFMNDLQSTDVDFASARKKNNYDHVESKVKLYRKNIQRQHLLNKRNNVEETFMNNLNITQPESSSNSVIDDLQMQLETLNKNYSKVLNDNVAKDMKIEYFRLELSRMEAQLKMYASELPDESMHSDVSQTSHHCSSDYTDSSGTDSEVHSVDDSDQILITKRSKLNSFRKASHRAIRKIFSCKDNSSQTNVGKFKMNRIDSKLIARSVHTPRTQVIRKVSMNNSQNDGIPNIIIKTPLKKRNLFKPSEFSDAELPDNGTSRKPIVRFSSPKVRNVSFNTPTECRMQIPRRPYDPNILLEIDDDVQKASVLLTNIGTRLQLMRTQKSVED